MVMVFNIELGGGGRGGGGYVGQEAVLTIIDRCPRLTIKEFCFCDSRLFIPSMDYLSTIFHSNAYAGFPIGQTENTTLSSCDYKVTEASEGHPCDLIR